MKRNFKSTIFISLIILIFTLAGCASNENATGSEDTTNDASVDNSEKKEIKRSAVYVESNAGVHFNENTYFEITDELDIMTPPDTWGNVNDDGSIDLYMEITDGTPYEIRGPVYDGDMFDMTAYIKSEISDGNAVGAGYSSYCYRFMPKRAGDAQIALLELYFSGDVLEGVLYEITVDDDLNCHLTGYALVSEEENIRVVDEARD